MDKLIEKLLKKLTDLQTKGQFSFNLETIGSLSKVDSIIEQVLLEEGYYDDLHEYREEFSEALKEQVKIYSTFGKIDTKSLDAFNKAAYENFYNKMAVGFTETNIKQPLKDALFQYISSSGRFADFKDAVGQILTENKIETNVKRVAKEFIFQYKRQQGQQLATEFNIQYFKYVGGEIDTTRPFCEARTGNIYTKKEIESWADEDWSGKIKGTNSTNIFIVCGGWECRHTLMPVPEKFALKKEINKYNQIETKK